MIKLSSSARKELEELAQDEAVTSSAHRSGSEEVAHDRLTGRVLPWQATRRFLRPEQRGLVVPTMVDDPDPSELKESDLAEAVTKSLTWRADDAPGAGSQSLAEPSDRVGDLRIDTAYLEPALLKISPERRYVPLRVHVVEDAVGSLTVQVVDDRLPLWAREQAARRLQGLVGDRPTSRFVTQLKQHAQHTLAYASDLSQLISEFRSLADGLPACPPDRRQREHDRAAALAGEIDRYTEALALTEMNVEVLSTSEQHRQAIVGLLERAERQVVIAVPWVRQKGVLAIRDALITAVGGGLQVTLLWGIDSAKRDLTPEVLDVLDSIKRHARATGQGGDLRYHRALGARSHAKIVVADDREMLITSQNFLSGSNHTEIGALLTAPPGPAGEPLSCPTITEVLKFLYDHVPDPATAFNLIHTRDGFGPRRDKPDLAPVPLPQLTAAVLAPNAPPEHAQAWAAAWQDAAQALADRSASGRPTVEVIKDGQHAALARKALEKGVSRVLLASHRVSKQMLTDEVCTLATERAAQGVTVAVRYGEVNDVESDARLKHLAAVPGLGGAGIRQDGRLHAKVVIRDDSTVLGSFNHLSVDAGVRSRRATGELSVRIASAAVADEVWAVLAGGVRVRQPSTPAAVGGPARDREAGVRVQRLLGLLKPLDGLPDIGSLAGFLQAEGTDRVLGTIERLDLDAGARRRLLAAAALPVLAEPGLERDNRLAALLPGFWAAGSWAGADQLRQHISPAGTAPRGVLTGALAAEAELVRTMWAAATEDTDLTTAEAEVLAVFACVGLLLGEFANAEAVDLLRDWRRPSTPRSDEFVAVAVAYLTRYAALPVELPDLSRAKTDEPDPDSSEGALRAALESLRRYDSHSHSGDAVRNHLFAPNGEMTLLAAALDAGDAAGLLAWEKSYSETNDTRWLIRATKSAGQPAITDHRKTSFIEKHRSIRLALRELNAALAADERAGLPPEQSSQLRRLRELSLVLAGSLPAGPASPEETALALSLGRLRARLSGDKAGARPAPGASLDSWALPRVAALREAVDLTVPPQPDLLEAVLRDLADGWTPEQATMFLVGQGEYGLADASISRLKGEGLVDAHVLSVLRAKVKAAQANFADELDARARTVSLRCDRAGLDADDPRWRDVATSAESRAQAKLRWTTALGALETAEEHRKNELADDLTACRAELLPDWAAHVDDLIEAGEFALATLALTPGQRHGRGLPPAVQLTSWSWRSTDLATVAAWFEPGRADVPRQVRTGFLPDLADEAAVRVVNALRAVAAGAPAAAKQWMEAVQSLVVETDAPPVVSPVGDGGATGEFILPFDVRLPRLNWVGQPPGRATVGPASPAEMLHLSLDPADSRPGSAVVSVSDVLGLLGRDSVGRPASMSNRALRFLSLVSSQLPLARVIAPDDTPAELTADRRMALVWLLRILGFYFSPAQLDTLRLLGGGHRVPLWHLIAAAQEDPVRGLANLRDRTDLDQILVEGLAADLASDIDLLVLSLVLLWEVRDRPSLAEALALAWEEAEAVEVPGAVGLDAAVDRLIGKRYLVEEPGGGFSACGCVVVRAQRRTDLNIQVHRLVKRVSATLDVGDLMFREFLAYAVHAEQADAYLRSPEERRDRARRNSERRMADRTPFDLCLLCTEEGRRADMVRDDVDVYCDVPVDAPLWLGGPEMPYQYLVRELLTNAIKAVEGRDQPGSVWLEVRSADAATAEIVVTDDGPGFPAEFKAAFEARRPVHRPSRPEDENVFHKLRMFAEDRGSRFELGERRGGGAVIAVRLPLASGLNSGEEPA